MPGRWGETVPMTTHEHRNERLRQEPVSVYALPEAQALAARLATALYADPGTVELRAFEDGEFKVRPLSDPAHRHCLVLAYLHGDVRQSPHDRLCQVLFLIAALRDHGARRIDLLTPYLAYARKDRRTQPFDPVSLRYVAQLLEAAGAASIATLEAHHAAAFDNAFRIPARSLAGHRMLGEHLSHHIQAAPGSRWVVVSPDPGGIKRAQLWREHLEQSLQPTLTGTIGFASLDKRRAHGVLTPGEHVCGEVDGAAVILVDDLIASGRTLAWAAQALLRSGAKRVIAAVSHDLHTAGALDLLAQAGVERLITSDSVPEGTRPSGEPPPLRVERLPCEAGLTELARTWLR